MKPFPTGLLVTMASVFVLGSGCLEAVDTYYSFEIEDKYINPGVFPGMYSDAASDSASSVLKPGPYKSTNATVVYLKSTRPHYSALPESVSAEGYVQIPIAYWLPKGVEGPVPVIVDAGPYFEVGRHCAVQGQNPCAQFVNDTIDWPGQTTPFALKNFLPHGYAVAQVAVRGTGTAGGCMDLMGPDEQNDLNQAITWLGTQPWSNGKVAMQGASYDGSTPWLVAAKGNPHLATIIPTAGLPDIFDLMFHNGSAETRGALMHGPLVYWSYGFSDGWPHPAVGIGQANNREAYQNRQNLLCPEAFEGNVMGAFSTATGHRGDPLSTYWRERDYRDDVLKNYKGSVFLVHGLQDWNVDPHAAIPFNAQLKAAGVPMKEWYGQWGHAFPDSSCSKDTPTWIWQPCRLDYAEVLFRWFEYWLKGDTTVDHGAPIQVQDNRGYWRLAKDYPVEDNWLNLFPTKDGKLATEAAGGASVTLLPSYATRSHAGMSGPPQYLEFKSQPLQQDLRVSGLIRLPIEFEAQGPGGYIGAWLFDENQTGHVLDRLGWTMPLGLPQYASDYGIPPVIAHAQMDLRYHQGGDQLSELIPGKRYVARVEFEPVEVFVPKGHRLSLWVFQYQYPDHFGSVVPSPIKILLGKETALRLPVVDVDPRHVFPVPGSIFPARDDYERFHVMKPVYSQIMAPTWNDALDASVCRNAWRAMAPAASYAMYVRGEMPAACAG